jgi:asparagine N-glycosylation enzyme membrane subunit Stt3
MSRVSELYPKRSHVDVIQTPSEEVVVIHNPPSPTNTVVSTSAEYTPAKVHQLKFWGIGAACFIIAFGIVALILGLVKPPAIQVTDQIGQPTGQINYSILFGMAAIVGIFVLIIFILVVLSRPEKFNRYT